MLPASCEPLLSTTDFISLHTLTYLIVYGVSFLHQILFETVLSFCFVLMKMKKLQHCISFKLVKIVVLIFSFILFIFDRYGTVLLAINVLVFIYKKIIVLWGFLQ